MAIGNQKVGQDWETVSQLYGEADDVLPFIAELEQQDHELSLFCPLQGVESDPYQLAIRMCCCKGRASKEMNQIRKEVGAVATATGSWLLFIYYAN